MGIIDTTSRVRLVQETSKITNDIKNHIPLGTLYLTNLPRSLSKDPKAPDNWRWFDPPLSDNPVLFSVDHKRSSFHPLVVNLKYLVDRGHIKLTYKILHVDLIVVRVYVIPSDIRGHKYLVDYRDIFRRGKLVTWHNTRLRKIMTNLLMILDYDINSWNGNLYNKQLIVFHCLKKYEPFNTNIIGSDFLGMPNQQIFNFHIERLMNRESFKDFKGTLNETDLETKLLDLYNNIHSPIFESNPSNMTSSQRSMILDILNNEIDGLKSELYPYQKQSVAKMLEREFFPQRMTTFLKFERGVEYFLDITTLQFYQQADIFVTPRGGILLENMGLGKTFICLALICCSKLEISQIPEDLKNTNAIFPFEQVGKRFPRLMDLCIKKLNEESIIWKPYQHQLSSSCLKLLEENPGSFIVPSTENPLIRKSTRISSAVEIVDGGRKLFLCNTTLVITPDNLFHQWLLEIKKHLVGGFLKILKINRLDHEIPQGEELIKYDLIMISNSAFANQSDNFESPLRDVYWKRLIIDEGHSMNSRLSRSVYMIKNLYVERKWAISGTPTAGLTRLHMNEEIDDENSDKTSPKKNKKFVVKRKFDVHQDLNKLGVIVSSFFQIDPWSQDSKLWTKQIVKPFLLNLFGSDLQLNKILSSLIVRHELEDIEKDVKLPPLHHKTVFLSPSFHDKISLNLFTAVLATNAVTSERTDQDYMFHPSNRSELRRLVANLQKLTFYWTGFTINDMEVLISICELAKKKKYASGKSYYSKRDVKLLNHSMDCAKMALSNPRWRTVSAIHEMSYFIKDLPSPFTRTLSVGVVDRNISTYGAPQLAAVQKFFYKNRFVKDMSRLMWKLDEYVKPFWVNYWKDTEKKNIQRIKNRDGQVIDSQAVTEALNPSKQYTNENNKREAEKPDPPSTPKKALKTSSRVVKTSPRQLMESESGGINTIGEDQIDNHNDLNLINNIKKLRILGTASSKLSYLASRLLEHQLTGVKSIVFFEFEESAYYLTELLDLIGVNYLMYATFIKLNQRLLNLSNFSTLETGMTLIMDLKLASHGLTIIAATRVYFINPIWKKAVEAQAIKRAHRIGQTNEVFVETLILKDTIEEEMFNKRVNDDKKPEKDVEAVTLIDDTGMQEFISKHIFLNMSDDDDEICKFEAPATIDTHCLGVVEDYDDLSNPSLLQPVGYLDEKIRKWDIPVFSEANLIKQNEYLQSKKVLLDDVDVSDDNNNKTEMSKLDRIKFAKKLRQERSHKSVKFA